MSAVFNFARNHRFFDGANPVTGVRLPKARRAEETYAYDLAEEKAMMNAVKDDLDLISGRLGVLVRLVSVRARGLAMGRPF